MRNDRWRATAKNPPEIRIDAAIGPTRTGQTSKLGITA
jgi:hypothetical protein